MGRLPPPLHFTPFSAFLLLAGRTKRHSNHLSTHWPDKPQYTLPSNVQDDFGRALGFLHGAHHQFRHKGRKSQYTHLDDLSLRVHAVGVCRAEEPTLRTGRMSQQRASKPGHEKTREKMLEATYLGYGKPKPATQRLKRPAQRQKVQETHQLPVVAPSNDSQSRQPCPPPPQKAASPMREEAETPPASDASLISLPSLPPFLHFSQPPSKLISWSGPTAVITSLDKLT